jgi:uncharacterized damage-inducible protein DinB
MTTSAAIIIDFLERVQKTATAAASGLTEQQLEARVDPEANTISWLLWHLARGQDLQISDVAGGNQVWADGGWSARFTLPFDENESGYAHSSDEVAAVRGIPSELLVGYLDAVTERSIGWVKDLTDEDLDRVIDERWTPPVTLAVRLVSIVSDDLQHAGQAAILRGIIQRTS